MFDNLNDAKTAANKNPMNTAAVATAIVMRVAKKAHLPNLYRRMLKVP